MRRSLAAIIAAVMLTCAPASLAAEPLVVTSVSPANGATLPPSQAIPFEVVVATPLAYEMHIEVSSQNILGQDGGLANDFQADYFRTVQSDAYPSIFRGQSVNAWPSAPGRYYWQVDVAYSDPTPPYYRTGLSPVYSFVVAPAAPPPEIGLS
jgi:hypothetical protein